MVTEHSDNPQGGHAQSSLSVEELLRFERFLAEISARFVQSPAEEVEPQILDGLKSIAGFLGVDRCTLTEYLPEKKESHTRYSYVPDGLPAIPPMRADHLFPWTTARLLENQVVILNYPESFPPEAEIDRRNAERGGFKTSINIPIVIGGQVRFILSAARITEVLPWPPELIPRLRLFGEILGNALVRKSREDEIKRLKDSLEQENITLREVVVLQSSHDEIIGKSEALLYVLYRLEQVARTDATVLLLGETGVGKELFARALHAASPRRNKPLVKLDCAGLTPSLFESELFGHERGAFTGAVALHKGRFEIASGGTVFLDEVGEVPLELQPKLLRVLQDGNLERVGGSKTYKVDVRIIAATNRDLEKGMLEGRFRRDLFYRLNAFPLSVPPLRDRTADIPLLVEHFIRQFSLRYSRPAVRVSRATMKMLLAYPWPGNVRELENVIERAVITSRGKTLDIPPLTPSAPRHGGGAMRSLAEVEREHLLSVLEKTLWRIEGPSGAAKILGLHPDTLRYRMKKLDIRRPRPADR